MIVFGAVGSGRSTHSSLVAENFGVVQVSTASLLSEEVEKNGPHAESIKAAMAEGSFVSDDVIAPLVVERLGREDCLEKGWVLDGFPATYTQARALQEHGIIPNKVVLLDAQKDKCVVCVVCVCVCVCMEDGSEKR